MLALAFATAKELTAALPTLGHAPAQGNYALAHIKGRKVLALTTGIGPVNAAFALGKLLGSTPAVDGIINLGVAGSFDIQTIPQGSVAVAATEISPEYGLVTADGRDPKGLGFAQMATAAPPIFDRIDLDPVRAALSMGLALPNDWEQAVSLTVMGVTGTPERAAAFEKRYQAGLENMEGFALALGCAQAELPFLEIRTISNRVGSRKKSDWDLPAALGALAPALETLISSDI